MEAQHRRAAAFSHFALQDLKSLHKLIKSVQGAPAHTLAPPRSSWHGKWRERENSRRKVKCEEPHSHAVAGSHRSHKVAPSARYWSLGTLKAKDGRRALGPGRMWSHSTFPETVISDIKKPLCRGKQLTLICDTWKHLNLFPWPDLMTRWQGSMLWGGHAEKDQENIGISLLQKRAERPFSGRSCQTFPQV
jgi:hypothetical protein